MNRDAETVPARHATPDLAKPGAEAGRTPLVLIESPYAGDVARNERYARACLADSLARGEAPFASHILYTQPGVLDDTDPAERHQGIQAGLAWGANATLTAVYDDLGITEGMRQGIARAEAEGRPVEVRQLAALPALLDDADALRAEVKRLTALVELVREWIDRRGVNVDSRDDDYMDGYRAAQRHALLDAVELRDALDGGVQ